MLVILNIFKYLGNQLSLEKFILLMYHFQHSSPEYFENLSDINQTKIYLQAFSKENNHQP